MKDSFFRSMTWLHTWVGLLVCWLLYLIFFSGTLSFFRDEISLWNQPAIHNVQTQAQRIEAQQQQIITGFDYLATQGANSQSWRITLPESRIPYLVYGYAKPKEPGQRRSKFENTQLNPNTMQKLEPFVETKGGNFFYRLHFDLHYIDVITARWLVCFASLFMLIAIISGVVIHKRIFKDMFSFRRNKGSRTWLDAHNLSSVLALPFHLMITYTGMITLIFMLFPYPAQTTYDSGMRDFFNDVTPRNTITDKAEGGSAMVPIQRVLDQVYTKWPNADITRVQVSNPNMASSTITVLVSSGKTLRDQAPRLIFSGASGELVAKTDDDLTASKALYESLNSLHTGRLADPLLRWLYFLGGVAGCVMIGSGCIMWAKRIRDRMKADAKPSLGLKLVEGLNLATLMGLPLATCTFFLANRILNPEITARADKEVLAFFLMWLAVAVIALLKRGKGQWQIMAAINGTACLSVPVVNALTTNGNIVSYLLHKQWALFTFDAVFLLFSILFFIQTEKLRTHKQPTKRSNHIVNKKRKDQNI
ncbi:PepSY-associated TM helix domain-containing protein [Pseudoalteromonas sp. S558]|uniref:PepSY-associated TM helix domain-containing protein n=1 Tax=Pseudoalteromonas sp. S558 TaxID=2066515 RepID=UPI00110B8612|nr:PepSY-associated TM helix domain-containing protein [Pseudoalteromonas sp. S558]TMO09950.1 PepSY domain-containing protein [Pseudoalteromonas sp. S558]